MVDALERPSWVFVEGEAGIGKTRLVREALATARERRVLVAACAPWRDPFPLGPVVVGLRRLWRRVGAVELSPLGGALRPLFPEWTDRLPPVPEPLEDPKETRHRLLCALTELVERLEVETLVVEDAHWADPATLEWLLLLAATDWASTVPSVVVTYRPTDVPEDSLLPRVTARSPAGGRRVRIVLEPLDVAAIRELVGSMLATDQVSTEFATFLHGHADGIPLAVEETVRLLRDRHDIVRQHGTWSRRVLEDLEVPPAVRDSVLERVDRLDVDAQRILQAASILGDQADEELLTAVADVDESAVQCGVAVALRSGLLREVTPALYGFRHVLDAQAIESTMPASERRRLHHRAAITLQRRGNASAAMLARHFREAGDLKSWSEHAELAADLAREAGDDHAAVLGLLDIFTTIDHAIDEQVRLARKLADMAFLGTSSLGQLSTSVIDALRSVLESDTVSESDRGELRLQLGRMLWRENAIAAFEEMEAAIPDLGARPDLAVRAMTNLAMPLIPEWPVSRHRSWLERAGELVERFGTSSDRRAFEEVRGTTLLLLGEEAGWTYVVQPPQRGAAPIEQRSFATALLNLATVSLPWGRYEESRSFLKAAVEVVDALDYRRGIGQARLIKAYFEWFTGHWADLKSAAAAIADLHEVEPRERLEARQLIGLLDLAAGSRSRAERQLKEVAVEYRRHHRVEPKDLAIPAALARIHLSEESVDKALQETEPAVEMVASKGLWHWLGDIAPVHLEALISADKLDRAAELVGEFAEGLAGRNAPAPTAALATCRAMLTESNGKLDLAAGGYAAAAEEWAALPRPYDELLTREREGRCLLSIGEQKQGVTVLVDAQQRLQRLGARWDADRIAQTLNQLGVGAPRASRRGPRGYGDQLSPREIEVMELVARGMTNKQIGEQLFLSPKTVDVHLRSARRKLGASTRVGAAMAAAEAGLINAGTENPAR